MTTQQIDEVKETLKQMNDQLEDFDSALCVYHLRLLDSSSSDEAEAEISSLRSQYEQLGTLWIVCLSLDPTV